MQHLVFSFAQFLASKANFLPRELCIGQNNCAYSRCIDISMRCYPALEKQKSKRRPSRNTYGYEANMLLLSWGKKGSFIDCYELEHGYFLSTDVRNESLSLKNSLPVQEEVGSAVYHRGPYLGGGGKFLKCHESRKLNDRRPKPRRPSTVFAFFFLFASRGALRNHSPSAPTSPCSGKPLPFF